MNDVDILKSITAPIRLVDAPPEVVKAVQRCVDVDDDGDAGPITIAAFNEFKQEHHLGMLGMLGKTTAAKLIEVVSDRINRKVTPEMVLAIARKEIGYKEYPPGSNQTYYGAWYGVNQQPWCAIWVSWCFYQAGLPLPATDRKGFAYCPFGVQWFKQHKRWHKTPQVGDVAFFHFGNGIACHVGIVEKVNSDGTITTIEGNTSNGGSQDNGGEVLRKTRRLNAVQGFGRPDWN